MTEIALGQLKSAEQSFLRVIKLVPEYQDCYLELGDRKTSNRLLKKFDEAQNGVNSGPNFRQKIISEAFAEYCRQNQP
mgnify:CR=1 FL=1